ncbi:hypothetical protein D1003_09250 [Riemerella anatipestifer]|nr:hypothetical protein [Riemerella anatipestifer]
MNLKFNSVQPKQMLFGFAESSISMKLNKIVGMKSIFDEKLLNFLSSPELRLLQIEDSAKLNTMLSEEISE